MGILSIDKNAKTVKGQKFGYITGIVYLAPANESGRNVCPNASEGCKLSCLYTAGMGVFKNVQEARIAKTLAFFKDKKVWLTQVKEEIEKLVTKAKKNKFIPCVRLNGTSDLPWENIKLDGKNLMEYFPDVQFYDYTKSFERMNRFLKGELPQNYHLTFSRSENNGEACELVLQMRGNVAVVFDQKLPKEFLGRPVLNGDKNDLRFLDKRGRVVGLKAKGKARKDETGFVVNN